MDSSAVPESGGGGGAGEVIDSVSNRKPMSNLAFESGGLGAQKATDSGGGIAGPAAQSAPDDQARMQKYGGLAKKSTPHMLLNRRKPQKNYFDSGDYNMARQLGAGRGGQGMKSRPALSSMVTGTMAPTPEAVEMTRHPHHEQSKLVEEQSISSNNAAAITSPGTPSGAVCQVGSFPATTTNGHSSNEIPTNSSDDINACAAAANSSDVAMEEASFSTNSSSSHFAPTQDEGHASVHNWSSGGVGRPHQLSGNN